MTPENLACDACWRVSRGVFGENGAVKRPINKQNLLVSAGVAVGLTFMILGFSVGITGREAQRLPASIEQMKPGPGDQVLQQSQIFVDFVDGYEARLTVNGIEMETTRLDELTSQGNSLEPGQQVEIPATAIYDPGNFTISFTPQVGAPIESFTQGEHSAVVTYWKIEDGPNKSRSFKWTFQAD
jgi:hypothetical protein